MVAPLCFTAVPHCSEQRAKSPGKKCWDPPQHGGQGGQLLQLQGGGSSPIRTKGRGLHVATVCISATVGEKGVVTVVTRSEDLPRIVAEAVSRLTCGSGTICGSPRAPVGD